MKPQHAFSLVELSIVLVILGLLTGGILAGQSLIRAAELRAVPTEYSKYQAALQTFRDKYFAIPGDFNKAHEFWGSLGGNGADNACQIIPATGQATCSGDGDGSLIDVANGNTSASYEYNRFWQHLANAALIEGQYRGTTTTTSASVAGRDVPGSRMSPAIWRSVLGQGYFTRNGTTVATSTPLDFGGDFGRNQLILTQSSASSSTAGSYPLKAEEAWNIDTKMDDGMPGLGRVRSNKGNATNTNCSTNANSTSNDSTANYALSGTSKDCMLIFPNAF